MTATRRHWHSAVLLLRLLRSISRSIHLNTPQQQQQKEGKRTHRAAHTFCKRSNPVQLQTRTIAVAFGLIRFHFSTSSLLHAVQSSCFSFLLKHAHASVCPSVSQSSHPSLDLSPSVVREWVCVRLLEILSVRLSGCLFGHYPLYTRSTTWWLALWWPNVACFGIQMQFVEFWQPF